MANTQSAHRGREYSTAVEPCISEYFRTSDNRPLCFRVAVSFPHPVTGKARPRSSKRFPLNTPREELRSLRDAWKREAARAWAPILKERQRQASEKLRAPRRRTRLARNIYQAKTGRRIEWSAPNRETGRRERHGEFFAGDPPLDELERIRDAREYKAKLAWKEIREDRRSAARARATERRRLRFERVERNIYKCFRRSDNVPVCFRVQARVPGKKRPDVRNFPLTAPAPMAEMRRWRDRSRAPRSPEQLQRAVRSSVRRAAEVRGKNLTAKRVANDEVIAKNAEKIRARRPSWSDHAISVEIASELGMTDRHVRRVLGRLREQNRIS